MINRFHNQVGRHTSLVGACALLAACLCAPSAIAQDTGADASARERAAKTDEAQDADAPRAGRLARTIAWAEAKMEGSGTRDGFYPELGGLITGAGTSIGPGYRHHVFGDRAIVNASAAMSWRRYSMMQSQLVWPRLLDDRLSVGAQVKYQDFTQVNFFGVGAGSLKSQQTDYRLRDLDASGFASMRANRWLLVSGRAGVLQSVEIERGMSALYPSTTDRFNEVSAPSLTREPRYVHADVALDADTRDVPGYPSRGGRYRISAATYHDQDFSRYSFRRIGADAAQYFPIGASVFAVRGRLDLSQTASGQEIPFYLLPTLGGSNSLRGYLDYRFRDRDLLLLNAEYRIPVARLLDLAAFYDAGTVAPTVGGLGHRLSTDFGAGLRLHSKAHMLARLDVARSREGMRVLLSFTAPLALPNRTVAPYVP